MSAVALLSLAPLLAPGSATAQPDLLATARADLEYRRSVLTRAYDLDTERQRLDRYVRIIARAFGNPALTRQDPIGRLPFIADDRREFLQLTSAFVAERLGVRLGGLTVKFSRLPKDTAGRVRLVGDRATVEVADRHRDDDEEILAIVAHEFAHIALDTSGSRAEGAQANEEELADAAVVMAGMGPLFLRACYREGMQATGTKVEWTVRRTGSLHPVAIAYLTLVQAEMAGLTTDTRRALVGDWLEPAWSARERR